MALRTLRYLMSAAALPAALVGAGGVALAGPWSPLALDRANSRYVQGDLDGAIAGYEAAAEAWHTPAVRAEAAERAAMIHLQRDDATRAASDLRRAAELSPSAAKRGAVRMQLATLYLDALGDEVRAAETFEQAEVELEDGAGALAAGRAWARVGRHERALDSWQQALQRLSDPAALAEARAGADVAARALGSTLGGPAPRVASGSFDTAARAGDPSRSAPRAAEAPAPPVTPPPRAPRPSSSRAARAAKRARR